MSSLGEKMNANKELKKDADYDIKDIEEFYEKYFARVKRKYSAKFMNSMALTMMFQEEEE